MAFPAYLQMNGTTAPVVSVSGTFECPFPRRILINEQLHLHN
jgi:hypothetical protein